VTFTGSTSVVRGVGEKAGAGLKAYTLELGGKSPVIVCPDVDIDKAVEVKGVTVQGTGLSVLHGVEGSMLGFSGAPGLHPGADIRGVERCDDVP
jgi:hypothetical protein